MAGAQRVWSHLSDTTRKRYVSSGKRQGLTPQQVQLYYESGKPLGTFRGHRPRPGASERQWSAMVKAARDAKLQNDVDGPMAIVLESLLAKGFKPRWIIDKLKEKKDSRDKFRTTAKWLARHDGRDAGWQPGRARYHRRHQLADIELFYYH